MPPSPGTLQHKEVKASFQEPKREAKEASRYQRFNRCLIKAFWDSRWEAEKIHVLQRYRSYLQAFRVIKQYLHGWEFFFISNVRLDWSTFMVCFSFNKFGQKILCLQETRIYSYLPCIPFTYLLGGLKLELTPVGEWLVSREEGSG